MESGGDLRIVRWPKRVNHKSVYQNTNQFTKTQNNFPKHKSVYQNTKQFLKTQISLPKHKTISQNTNQFRRNTNQFTKTQINFSKHKPISSKHKSFSTYLYMYSTFEVAMLDAENPGSESFPGSLIITEQVPSLLICVSTKLVCVLVN